MWKELKEFNIQVAPNYTVTKASGSKGPIFLVLVEGADGQIIKSRFDVQKAMFIDPLNVEVGEQGIKKLVKSLSASSNIRRPAGKVKAGHAVHIGAAKQHK